MTTMLPDSSRQCVFVVLHHTGFGEPHFDLMIALDDTGPLATWRCRNWPIQAGDSFISLSGHRRTYLTYEGPVSGGRGEVTRVSQGFCSVTVAENDMISVGFDDVLVFLALTRD